MPNTTAVRFDFWNLLHRITDNTGNIWCKISQQLLLVIKMLSLLVGCA